MMPPAMVDAHTPREAAMKIDNTTLSTVGTNENLVIAPNGKNNSTPTR